MAASCRSGVRFRGAIGDALCGLEHDGMTETTTWTCRVVDCTSDAVAGWGGDLHPPVEVCAGHLDDLAGGAVAIHTNGGQQLLVRQLRH
jgi:hypothetical protein